MPQQRFYDYSKPSSSSYENAIHYALNQKGVYRGMDLGVDSVFYYLTIAAGYGLQHDGIIWYESTDTTIAFYPPAAATVYTVIATHDNRQIIGGVSVDYDIVIGELTNVDVVNGVVLGWIYHPGGVGIPLSIEMILSAPKSNTEDYATALANTAPVELIAPMQRSIVTSVDLDITFVPSDFDAINYVLFQDVQNAPLAVMVETLVQQVQLYVQGATSTRPISFSFYHNFTTVPTTELVVEVYDTGQSPVKFENGFLLETIHGTGGWSATTVVLDRTDGTFDIGKPYTLRLTYNVAPGKNIQLGRIRTSFWPYP